MIRSRFSPQDPVLNETLLMYAEYLEKKRQFGELAYVCLAIGTRPARYRAVHVLAKTEDVIYLDLALDIVQYDRDHEAHDDSDWALPQSFFIDMIAKALYVGRFDVADKAARLLPSNSKATSSTSVSMQLARCFIGICAEVEKHAISSNPVVEEFEIVLSACDEAKHLLSFLTDESIVIKWDLWQQYVDSGSGGTFEHKQQYFVGRSRNFWSRVLLICKENGISAQNPSELDAAQDYLMLPECFAYLYQHPSGSISSCPANVLRRLQLCRRLLQFVLDLESGYLVSGLEHVQEALAIAAQGQVTEEFEVVSLLFPRGLLSLNLIPSMGELADESADARRLWGSFILSQCDMLLRAANKTQVTQHAMVSPVLEYLREELICPITNAADSLNCVDKTRLTALLEGVRTAVASNNSGLTANTHAVDDEDSSGSSIKAIENELDSLLALIAQK